MTDNAIYYQFHEARASWLPMDSLYPEALYIIDARNAHLGIWNPVASSFSIARSYYRPQLIDGRMKWLFDCQRLSEEYHWDTGEPFGTAKPLILIEEPGANCSDDLLTYLTEAENRIPLTAARALVAQHSSGS